MESTSLFPAVFGFTETNIVNEETGLQSAVGLGLIKGAPPISAVRGVFTLIANPINASKFISKIDFLPETKYVPVL